MALHDLDAVLRLEEATPEAPHWSRAAYEDFLSVDEAGKQIFLAEECGDLRGFVAGQIILDVCELESIVVDVAARGKGVGSALVVELFSWAIHKNVIRVQLEVRSGNSRAIVFYTSSGFVRDGLRAGYYRQPDEDAVLMSRALDSASDA
jgi:ribosomal-protein-alanine N-acetyltransferase